jgi:hypothetical protein
MKPATAMLTFLAALLAPLATASPSAAREWHFDVSLDGRAIGEHRFQLREEGGARELVSEANFRVRFLFIEAYRYEHRAREQWQGDCLARLDARTDANGKQTVVSGERTGAGFRLEVGDNETSLDRCVQTFAYWNPSILDARWLLNPQTGEYQSVKVLEMGKERIGDQPATRYRLIGSGGTPLEIDLWYTPALEWLALESKTPEGRRLRYSRR